MTVPVGRHPVAETVTAIDEVSPVSTDAGVGVAVTVGAAFVTVIVTVPWSAEFAAVAGVDQRQLVLPDGERVRPGWTTVAAPSSRVADPRTVMPSRTVTVPVAVTG